MGCTRSKTVESKEMLTKKKTISSDLKKGQFNDKICEIQNDGKKGLGFLCNIFSPDKKEATPVLITSYQLLGGKDIISGKKIEFKLNNKTYCLKIDDSRKVYLEKDLYNVSVIEIKEEDNIGLTSLFDIEINNRKINLAYLRKQTVMLLNKDNDGQLDMFKCEINAIKDNGYEIEYKCNSIIEEIYGCPLLNVNTNKIIGFHKQYFVMDDISQGILLEDIVNEFNLIKKNNIDIKLDQLEENKRKAIKESIKVSQIKTIKTIKIERMKNEIVLVYAIPPSENRIKIFGEKFVKNNYDKCYFLLQDVLTQELFEFEIGAYLNINQLPESSLILRAFVLILIQTDYMTDLSDMFYNCNCLINAAEIGRLNTDGVTDMSFMFFQCTLLSNLDEIGKLDVSEVTNMSFMFEKCLNLKKLDLSNWKISKIKNIKAMFENCSSLEEIKGLSNWDVSRLKDASFLFNICRSLTEIPDISNWNMSNVSNISYMFQECFSIENIPDISKWNTKNVQKMKGLFLSCTDLKSLPDISQWDVSNVEDLSEVFL